MQGNSAASGMFEWLDTESGRGEKGGGGRKEEGGGGREEGGRREEDTVQQIQRSKRHLQLLEVAAGEHAVGLVDDNHAERVQRQEVCVTAGDELPQATCTTQTLSIGRQMKRDREVRNNRNAETSSTPPQARAG
jgi:hypothetical protein